MTTWTTRTITMAWTREKAIEMLTNPYMKSYLKKLSNQELFQLGIKEGYWEKLE